MSDLPTKSNVTNITDLLQARAPGVQIQAGSGTVGAASDIRIRGAGSFTVTQPIMYIDGIRMSTAGLGNFDPSGQGLAGNSGGQGANALDLLNPSDIESIEIVRGPAAATLYGADAANGVIQVITKKGARGQQNVQWSARADYGKNDLGSVDLPQNYTTCDATKQAAHQTNGTPLWPGCQGVAVNTILVRGRAAHARWKRVARRRRAPLFAERARRRRSLQLLHIRRSQLRRGRAIQQLRSAQLAAHELLVLARSSYGLPALHLGDRRASASAARW